jgi:hypothetical protein
MRKLKLDLKQNLMNLQSENMNMSKANTSQRHNRGKSLQNMIEGRTNFLSTIDGIQIGLTRNRTACFELSRELF